jgi:hypothetical protein
MNALLPWLHDHVEPAAGRIAERAAALEPSDAQRAYHVEVSQEIVRLAPTATTCREGPVARS